MQRTASGLNATTIKTIAVIAMIIDHATWAFVDSNTFLAAGLHAIGRLTGPIMFYFIAEGYHHTHDIKKYLGRLALFTVISHIPYNLFINHGQFSSILQTSVIFTLFCGLLALFLYDTIKQPVLRILAIVFLALITFRADWGIVGVVCILAFGFFHGDKKKQMLVYAVIVVTYIVSQSYELIMDPTYYISYLYRLGMFLPIAVLWQYNGVRGGNAVSKWLFYIAYPLQFLVIGFLWFHL